MQFTYIEPLRNVVVSDSVCDSVCLQNLLEFSEQKFSAIVTRHSYFPPPPLKKTSKHNSSTIIIQYASPPNNSFQYKTATCFSLTQQETSNRVSKGYIAGDSFRISDSTCALTTARGIAGPSTIMMYVLSAFVTRENQSTIIWRCIVRLKEDVVHIFVKCFGNVYLRGFKLWFKFQVICTI